ncbi:hypothetical protein K8P10_001085 [Leucobacter sp. Psy1]|uniref:murein biosynthesis integral membrane protein MurJ n=1 Tax=Leucobacter sp. Psy1 TaxID=2875729 RepID=UPI001CD40754|nr:lipid II flippase MurJ [Leucobacter sp. Psy1]UBH05574.1 hypothetical protein K8P10_001085 [Leucobacter sp. Psy1]
MAGSVGRAGLWIASGTLTSRVLGLVRAMVLAYAIGSIGFGANAFANAGKVPNTVYTLIATGALTAVLVPQITKAALAADGGARYINKLITLALVGSGAIMVIAGVFTPPLISWLGSSWSADQVELATVFAFWLLPQILFYSLYTVLGEVLNARSLFGPYAWSPVLNNVLNIAGLIGFVVIFGADPDGVAGAGRWDLLGIALVAGSATLGVASQALILFAFWRRAGLTFRIDFGFRGIGLGTMGKVAGWTFLTVLLTQAVGLFNTRVMNLAGSGEAGLAAAELAGLIFVLPHSIITISLVTARFTRMSENVHAENFAAFTSDITSSARLVGFSMMFFTAAMLVLAFPLIRLIQPGATYGVVSTVSVVLIANLIGLLPFSLLFVLNRGFFALSDTRTPFFIAVGQSALTILAAIFCTTLPSEMITATLTGVISSLFVLQMLATFLLLRRRVGILGGRGILGGIAQNLVAAVVAALAGWGVLALLGGIEPEALAMRSFLGAFIACAIVTVAMAVVYGLILLVMRNREAISILARLRGMLPGSR